MLAFGRLLRLSLAPSAAADIAAGIVLAAGRWPPSWKPYALVLASLCVYHGGMGLNDWADRHADAARGRGRPIPSGAVSARTALRAAAALLLVGPLIAFPCAPRCALVLGAVSALAAIYDLAGRGPWLGPLLLAACRAGNLSTGMLLEVDLADYGGSWLPHVASFYGIYVFCVSRLARLEDASDADLRKGRPALGLGIAGCLLALTGFPALVVLQRNPSADRWLDDPRTGAIAGTVIASAGALGLIQKSVRQVSWTRGDVMDSVGMALRRLLVATAAIAAQAGTRDGLCVACAILCGYPLSFLLRRVFPPT
jgi:4-hydroxybenzoate polyprenyltransferase